MLQSVLSKTQKAKCCQHKAQPLTMAKTALRVELVSYDWVEGKQPSHYSFLDVDLPIIFSKFQIYYSEI